jgi:dienelactone hydrolase
MTQRDASSRDETMTFIPSEHGTLFAIVTHPIGTPNGVAVVLLHGDGSSMSASPNRFGVTTARRLAASGFLAVRFDAHGAGDSFGVIERFELQAREPFVDDLIAVYHWLEEQGVTRFAFVGVCGGARTALAAMARCPKLEAMVLALLPVLDGAKGEELVRRAREKSLRHLLGKSLHWRIVKRLANPDWRSLYWRAACAKARSVRFRLGPSTPTTGDRGGGGISPQLLQQLRSASSRQVSMLALYGDGQRAYRTFLDVAGGSLAPLLTGQPPALEVQVLPCRSDRFLADLEFQAALLEATAEWLPAAADRQAEAPLRT